jgi:hypothetical protein
MNTVEITITYLLCLKKNIDFDFPILKTLELFCFLSL